MDRSAMVLRRRRLLVAVVLAGLAWLTLRTASGQVGDTAGQQTPRSSPSSPGPVLPGGGVPTAPVMGRTASFRATRLRLAEPRRAVDQGASERSTMPLLAPPAQSDAALRGSQADDTQVGAYLLPPDGPYGRSEQMEQIAQQADAQIGRGFELAGRAAYFSARLHLVRALRMVAEGLDAQQRTSRHSRSLSAALMALKEAEDFVPRGVRLESIQDLRTIIRSHQTPVLRTSDLSGLTPSGVMRCYFTFAQEQLSAAVGHEVAGSMALHGLGKLHVAMASDRSVRVSAAEPKAMACFQAALLVCPQNYMAANDLGVLLARGGNYREAQDVLLHSLNTCPRSTSWQNLAQVFARTGQTGLAQRATQLAAAARQTETRNVQAESSSPLKQVQWLDQGAFAQTYHPGSAPPSATVQPAAGPPVPAKKDDATGPLATPPRPSWFRLGQRERREDIVLCQALGPAAPCNICAVDCSTCDDCCHNGWERARLIAWQAYAQGEYVGHERLAHVPEYRLRVDDQLDMIYRITRDISPNPYKLNVGDEIRVESFSDEALTRDLVIQPDGSITLRLLGQMRAAGYSISQLRDLLEEAYQKYYKVPAITVTPLKVNTKLEDLRAAVDRRAGVGGQSQFVRITPEGTIALPALGSVNAQGLSLPELQEELNERYRQEIEGIEVIPVLVQRAPRFIYVLGEVNLPGRFELPGPTTLLQALGTAGSWRVGANLHQIVVFRRGDDWRLLATMVDLHAALHGKQPCPPGEIWLSDSDVIVVPKSRILVADDFINLVFTRGIYGVFPLSAQINFAKLSSI